MRNKLKIIKMKSNVERTRGANNNVIKKQTPKMRYGSKNLI